MSWCDATETALVAAARARLLVLDVDGVLLDPKPSFYRAALESAAWAFRRAFDRDPKVFADQSTIDAFKAAGGWNDDFDLAVGLAWSMVLHETGLTHPAPADTARRSAGGLDRLAAVAASELESARFKALSKGVDTQIVRLRAAARYSGKKRCREMYGIDPALFSDLPDDGLWPIEPVLCDARPLQRPWYELAMFTGRNAAEAELAVERLGMRIDVSRRIVDDGVIPRKPAPDGLIRLAGESLPMLYVGDSIDDQNATLAARKKLPDGPTITFARVLPADATAAERADARAAGADLVVPGLDALFAATAPFRQE